jgi:motility quorum-sensing regulator/GCU-specific mRNA interferase toxin
MEKRRPHYSLEQIRRFARNPNKIRFTRTALDGGIDLGFDLVTMSSTIMNLNASDFYKSMTTYADSKVWQDVYRPLFQGKNLYLKLTVTEDHLLVVSFKRR